jgi:PKD repeat protein
MTEEPSLLSTISIRYVIIIAVIILALIPVLVVFNIVPVEQQVSVNITMDQTDNLLLLHHAGGDALNKDRVSITIDNSAVPEKLMFMSDGQDWPWSIGKTIAIPLSPHTGSRELIIWYGKENDKVQIFTGTVLPVVSPVTVTPTPVVPETQVSSSPTQTAGPVIPTRTPTVTPALTQEQTPALPVAEFDAVPRTGSAPLTVVFEDLSTGVPESWEWTFGDNGTSDVRNPVHTFAEPGIYTVSLNVKNALGANAKIRQGYVVAKSPAPRQDIFLEGSRDGYLLPGVIQFRVNGDNSKIKIGGRWVYPADGDIVRIVLNTEGKGIISVTEPFIVQFEIPSAVLYLNGGFEGEGAITDIRITSFDGFLSDLTLSLPASEGSGRIIYGGTTRQMEDYPGPVTISHIYPDRSGTLNLDTYFPGRVKFQGSAEEIIL